MNINYKMITLLSCLLLYQGVYSTSISKEENLPSKVKKESLFNITRSNQELLVDRYCRHYNLPIDLVILIGYFITNTQYQGKDLPASLIGKDLTSFDFTGCHFTNTNLTYSILERAILTNTTCDYRKTFVQNLEQANLSTHSPMAQSINHHLTSIATFYPEFSNTQKGQLLLIASGFSLVPLYQKKYMVSFQNWLCKIFVFKKRVGALGTKLSTWGFSMVELNDDLDLLQWDIQTEHKINEERSNDIFKNYFLQAKHNLQYTKYIEAINQKKVDFEKKSSLCQNLRYYKYKILDSIKGLSKAYRIMQKNNPKKYARASKEALHIAESLAQSSRFSGLSIVDHFISCQNHILNLSLLIPKEISCKLKYDLLYYIGWDYELNAVHNRK